VKASQESLRDALRGRVTRRHRFLLRLHLDQIDALDVAIGKIDQEVEASIAPFRTAVEQVSSVPGVKNLAALQILSEIGTDMSRFPSDGNLVSWACICPRSDESAGKRRSTRIRKGSPWLKTALVQCAHSAARTKGSYFQSLFHRIRSRRGVNKAIVAVAASILTGHLSHAERRNHVSAPTTTGGPRSGRRTASSNDWLTSATLWNSLLFSTSVAPEER
jgi:transposase